MFKASKTEILDVLDTLLAIIKGAFLLLGAVATGGHQGMGTILTGIKDFVNGLVAAISYLAKFPALKQGMHAIGQIGGAALGVGVLASLLTKLPLLGKAFTPLVNAIGKVGAKGLSSALGGLSSLLGNNKLGNWIGKLSKSLGATGKGSAASINMDAANTQMTAAEMQMRAAELNSGKPPVTPLVTPGGPAGEVESTATTAASTLTDLIGNGVSESGAIPLSVMLAGMPKIVQNAITQRIGKGTEREFNLQVKHLAKKEQTEVNKYLGHLNVGQLTTLLKTTSKNNTWHKLLSGMLKGMNPKQLEKEVAKDGSNVGLSLIRGTVDAVNKHQATVGKSTGRMGKHAINELRKATGVHSPSTLTREVGIEMVAGLVLGIRSDLNKLVQEDQMLADRTITILRSYTPEFEAAGRSWGSAVAAGIDAEVGAVTAAAQRLAAAATSAMAMGGAAGGRSHSIGLVQGLRGGTAW